MSEPGCTLFLHYSGHGSQVEDVDSNRSTGLDDSIVPVDFEYNGQLSSTLLHQHLVTRMAPGCTLFILMVFNAPSVWEVSSRLIFCVGLLPQRFGC